MTLNIHNFEPIVILEKDQILNKLYDLITFYDIDVCCF